MSSIRKVVQCVGHNKSGHRCQRKTAKTDLCYQHLEAKYHVQIKRSHIRAAGMGLYSTVARKRGENFAPYSGVKVVTQDPDFGGDYVLQIKKNPPTFIDARATSSGAGRYSNNARQGQGTNNAKLSYNTGKGEANLKATKNVPKGSEIFTAYGNTYWNRKE